MVVGGTDEEYIELCLQAEHEAWARKVGDGPMPSMILQLLFGKILRLLREGRLTEAMTTLERDIEIFREQAP